MQVADAYVPQAVHICQMAFALAVPLLNTGITKTRPAKDALTLSFMIKKNNNVYVPLTNLTFLKKGVFHATCHTTGILT